MKKIFTFFAAALTALSMSAASYGILVNGKTYFAGTQVDEYEGFQQYLAHVPVKAGDFCQLCDAENKSVWAVDLNTASVEGFTRNGDKYDVSVDGCYDFYIKLKYGQDQLYIGPGSNCGDGIDISGGGGGGEEPDDINYYAMGWINAADAGENAYDTYDDNLLFVDGKLTIDANTAVISVSRTICAITTISEEKMIATKIKLRSNGLTVGLLARNGLFRRA